MNLKIFYIIGVSSVLMSNAGQAKVKKSNSEKVNVEIQELIERARSAFSPISKDEKSTDPSEVIELGQKLFFDYRLSKDGSTACVRCHLPHKYSTDGLKQSRGFNNNLGERNAQSVFNLKYQTIVHWRNDRSSIEDQAMKAFTSPVSLGNKNEKEALERLRLAGYEESFKKIFSVSENSLSLENAAKALGAYQRSLTTRADFDKFLEGDVRAISTQAQAGLSEFMTLGCTGCHNGVAVGGKDLQRFGIYDDYWNLTKTKVDKGRYDVTRQRSDLYIFKVPSLRNVSQTAPYFHDGSAENLETAIRWMAKLQLNQNLSEEQVANIKAFLESLKGDLPQNFKNPIDP